jgi:glucosamine--fructose-6-phosphate aminotransferase (isomerizing)
LCGIFGIVSADRQRLARDLESMFKLSESRGKEAAGIAILDGDEIRVMKEPESASRMLRMARYRRLVAAIQDAPKGGRFIAIGHSRLVTNGNEAVADNNQPVIRDGLIAIHNGIIVNDAALWHDNPDLKRRYAVDTEILVALIARQRAAGQGLARATVDAFGQIVGTASVGILDSEAAGLVLATNNGSLYYYEDDGRLFFASERFILASFLATKGLGAAAESAITAVLPGSGLLVLRDDPTLDHFTFDHFTVEQSPPAPDGQAPDLPAPAQIRIVNLADALDPRHARLRRCSRCILPETMPFICFDAQGVCNYCHEYKPYRPLGMDALRELVAPLRRTDGRPDCMIAVSGGRDSCYGLHILKHELGLNPVAYTYDWGLITDLARRNQARLCGQLGVEHILVSADIRKKRAYVRQNVLAWLKRPELGMVPLFMAGDKQYFYYADQVRRQSGVDATFLCENVLERAHFKSGFMGVNEGQNRVFDIGIRKKLAVLMYYARQYAANPRYLNASMKDTLFAFHSAYFRDHNQIQLFQYAPWDEDEMIGVLRQQYDWELSPETTSTWRIGDGTAAFYNYIYYTIAGFTENDALRSNQIRQGTLDRDTALKLVARENEPRWESLQWYAATIGFSLAEALQAINLVPRLYDREGRR